MADVKEDVKKGAKKAGEKLEAAKIQSHDKIKC